MNERPRDHWSKFIFAVDEARAMVTRHRPLHAWLLDFAIQTAGDALRALSITLHRLYRKLASISYQHSLSARTAPGILRAHALSAPTVPPAPLTTSDLNETYESSDTENDHREHRIIRRHKPDRRDLHMISHPLPPNRTAHAHVYDSNSDYSDSDLSIVGESYAQERKLRNKKLLTIGLACITTIAAGNNIIQSTAAHRARRKLIEEGEMGVEEAVRLGRRALLLDFVGVAVAAVGVHNARNGWRRVEGVGRS